VAAGLAQEELQRVRGRLGHGHDGRRLRRLLGRVDEVDAARVELAVDEIDLDRVEVVHLDQLDKLGALQGPGSLAGLEERPDLLDLEEPLDLGHGHLGTSSTRVTAQVKQVGEISPVRVSRSDLT
jgi:hypothetical protein